MLRVEFRLSMPNRGSWNGEWSGKGRNYVIYKHMTSKRVAELLDGKETASFYHRWDDGWGASIAMRVMGKGERRQKSDGFSGYGWMVDNVIWRGETKDEVLVISEFAKEA